MFNPNHPPDAKSDSTALENSRLASAQKCWLHSVCGRNGAVAQEIQIFDLAALPANGTFTPLSLPVAANDWFAFFFGPGQPMANGIVVCNSTTANTKTIGAADCSFSVAFRKKP